MIARMVTNCKRRQCCCAGEKGTCDNCTQHTFAPASVTSPPIIISIIIILNVIISLNVIIIISFMVINTIEFFKAVLNQEINEN